MLSLPFQFVPGKTMNLKLAISVEMTKRNIQTETIPFGDSKVNYLIFYQRFSCVSSLFAASFTKETTSTSEATVFSPLSLLMKGCKGAIRIFWPVRALPEPCG